MALLVSSYEFAKNETRHGNLGGVWVWVWAKTIKKNPQNQLPQKLPKLNQTIS